MTLLAWGLQCDLIVDGMFVNGQTEALPFRHDLFACIGHLFGLGCLAVLPVFHFSLLPSLVGGAVAISNEITVFSPFHRGWKKLLWNAAHLLVAWGIAYLASRL